MVCCHGRPQIHYPLRLLVRLLQEKFVSVVFFANNCLFLAEELPRGNCEWRGGKTGTWEPQDTLGIPRRTLDCPLTQHTRVNQSQFQRLRCAEKGIRGPCDAPNCCQYLCGSIQSLFPPPVGVRRPYASTSDVREASTRFPGRFVCSEKGTFEEFIFGGGMAGGSSLRTQLRALQTVPEVYRSQNFLCRLETEDADVLAARLEAAEESEREQQRKYRAVFIPVDPQLEKEINCEILNTDIRNYPWKETPFGDVYYSPRYSDERYTYRHVILSRGVRKEAEKLASTMPDGLLTEDMFIHCLGIALSPGWTHFMCFNRKLKELILRRPREDDNPKATQGASKVDGAPGEGDEVDVDSDDEPPPEANPPRTDAGKSSGSGDCRPDHKHCDSACSDENFQMSQCRKGEVEVPPVGAACGKEWRERSLRPETRVSVEPSKKANQGRAATTGETGNGVPLSRRPHARNISAKDSTDLGRTSAAATAVSGTRQLSCRHAKCVSNNIPSCSEAQSGREFDHDHAPAASYGDCNVSGQPPEGPSSARDAAAQKEVLVRNRPLGDRPQQKRTRDTQPLQRPRPGEPKLKLHCAKDGSRP
ncbi:cyclin-dependent kinase regulatory subunit protein [Toxoplasma gondii GT1]|uniref:Cyclin-dependent kinases regulatory subunit n=4 Tax=Toxoplasma gondii TaxID=5811 RepID=S7V1N1_TOXGG|nr:cyclin-dependent kinase regulatory subunit protein [Toxoplasma gondii GT1]KAF4638241.1 cyclin-dependent kinase regulatory subunit protein [Toxoplasma gondii]PIM05036.1 cyclin-dependent kinase regulatory subunit protein [Toxoplasma gondii COUG]RQX71685.1 cyclin-dependent kinase regulatory subunit protein [Toxoplasma gondii CAST]